MLLWKINDMSRCILINLFFSETGHSKMKVTGAYFNLGFSKWYVNLYLIIVSRHTHDFTIIGFIDVDGCMLSQVDRGGVFCIKWLNRITKKLSSCWLVSVKEISHNQVKMNEIMNFSASLGVNNRTQVYYKVQMDMIGRCFGEIDLDNADRVWICCLRLGH